MKYFLKNLSELLNSTSTPLWVSLLGFLIGGLGIYIITPKINQNLERQKIKSEYVVRSLENINSKTQEMFAEISIANRKISSNQTNFSDNIDKATRLATELQWKALEISSVLSDRKSSAIIKLFQNELGKTRDAFVEINSSTKALSALDAIQKFIPASLLLTNRIATLSGIKFDQSALPTFR